MCVGLGVFVVGFRFVCVGVEVRVCVCQFWCQECVDRSAMSQTRVFDHMSDWALLRAGLTHIPV